MEKERSFVWFSFMIFLLYSDWINNGFFDSTFSCVKSNYRIPTYTWIMQINILKCREVCYRFFLIFEHQVIELGQIFLPLLISISRFIFIRPSILRLQADH